MVSVTGRLVATAAAETAAAKPFRARAAAGSCRACFARGLGPPRTLAKPFASRQLAFIGAPVPATAAERSRNSTAKSSGRPSCSPKI